MLATHTKKFRLTEMKSFFFSFFSTADYKYKGIRIIKLVQNILNNPKGCRARNIFTNVDTSIQRRSYVQSN